ncbi:MAG: glycosyltransferase family 2 protein [Pelagimonas sp.]|uniref:glycosyltransferase family 2 protein n=1 Tax=Pelagimonas sp. TaxID=2073170 RepID=UPI003D6C6187
MTPSSSLKTALAACMKNEGIFVLEWLAYHLCLGFDPIIVVTNDCDDGSPALLDRLAEMGLITHIQQVVPEGKAPQDAGMDHVLRFCRDNGVSHLLHIDSDEFLFLPQWSLEKLRKRNQKADVVAIPWINFGDGGVRDWVPGDLVTERNTMSEPDTNPGVTKFKSLFKVASFARATDHNPLEPLIDTPKVTRPDGRKLRNGTLYQPKSARYRPLGMACNVKDAFIFHYAVRSEDLFLMKNDRGDGQGKNSEDDTKYHLGSHWHEQANRNDVENTLMERHLAAIKAKLAELRHDPKVAQTEQACQDWFLERRAQVLTPERRAIWSKEPA